MPGQHAYSLLTHCSLHSSRCHWRSADGCSHFGFVIVDLPCPLALHASSRQHGKSVPYLLPCTFQKHVEPGEWQYCQELADRIVGPSTSSRSTVVCTLILEYVEGRTFLCIMATFK